MTDIKISAKRLKELERAQAKLNALEAGGVDNWEWYSESLKDWFKENLFEELLDDIVANLHDIMIDGIDWDFPAGREAGISLNFNESGEEQVKQIVGKLIKEYIDSTDD